MDRFSKTVIAILLLLALLTGLIAIYLMTLRAKPAPTTPVTAPVAVTPPIVKPAPTYAVLVAANHLTAGHVLEAKDLKIAQWPHAPAESYTEKSELINKRLRRNVNADEPLLFSTLAQGLATHLEKGQRAITIPVNALSLNGNRFAPGDYVDVFFTLNSKSGEIKSSQSRLLLAKTQLLAIGNQSVDGPLVMENSKGQTPPAPNSAILAINVEQVNPLLLASREGQLELVLRSPDDKAVPNQQLFPERTPLLAAKATLKEDELLLLQDPENKAFAGDSLIQFAGSEAEATNNNLTTKKEEPHLQAPPPRTVEIIRGRSRHIEAY